MLISMKQLLDKARKGNYAVGAFNVSNMEQIIAVMDAAKQAASPVIIQVTGSALAYSRFLYVKYMIRAANEQNPEIPFAMHLDHGPSLEVAKKAIELGFTSVMIDGSLKEDRKTASSFEENVEITKSVVAYAQNLGITVEGELGTIGGVEDGSGSKRIIFTDPEKAKEFVRLTGIDALAVAIGTSHGAQKFAGEPKLAIDILIKIRENLPITPLVLHGASSVPDNVINKINKYGGNIISACGVPADEIKKAIANGINKINVDTDIRLTITASIRQVFSESPAVFDPRDYMKPAMKNVTELIRQRMDMFGCAGHARDFA